MRLRSVVSLMRRSPSSGLSVPPRLLSAYRIGTAAHLDQRREVVNQPGVVPIGQGYGCAAGNGSGRYRVGDRATGSASTACVSGRVWVTAAAGTAIGHGYRIGVHGVRVRQGMPHGGSRDRVSHRHRIGVDGVRVLHGRAAGTA